ncbi:MAG TPA: hypothetical protein VI796_02950, partial [Candidatus Thermoplasmatota archaeon]|nr:hypothetical protein [Candidatus Thermoplasmatota archaeon]
MDSRSHIPFTRTSFILVGITVFLLGIGLTILFAGLMTEDEASESDGRFTTALALLAVVGVLYGIQGLVLLGVGLRRGLQRVGGLLRGALFLEGAVMALQVVLIFLLNDAFGSQGDVVAAGVMVALAAILVVVAAALAGSRPSARAAAGILGSLAVLFSWIASGILGGTVFEVADADLNASEMLDNLAFMLAGITFTVLSLVPPSPVRKGLGLGFAVAGILLGIGFVLDGVDMLDLRPFSGLSGASAYAAAALVMFGVSAIVGFFAAAAIFVAAILAMVGILSEVTTAGQAPVAGWTGTQPWPPQPPGPPRPNPQPATGVAPPRSFTPSAPRPAPPAPSRVVPCPRCRKPVNVYP